MPAKIAIQANLRANDRRNFQQLARPANCLCQIRPSPIGRILVPRRLKRNPLSKHRSDKGHTPRNRLQQSPSKIENVTADPYCCRPWRSPQSPRIGQKQAALSRTQFYGEMTSVHASAGRERARLRFRGGKGNQFGGCVDTELRTNPLSMARNGPRTNFQCTSYFLCGTASPNQLENLTFAGCEIRSRHGALRLTRRPPSPGRASALPEHIQRKERIPGGRVADHRHLPSASVEFGGARGFCLLVSNDGRPPTGEAGRAPYLSLHPRIHQPRMLCRPVRRREEQVRPLLSAEGGMA